jgi:hypothetical protein
VFFILAGGVGSGNLLYNGFGFKAVGNTLYGIIIVNGSVVTQSLSVTLSVGTFVELLAIVRSSGSIEFVVDGVSKSVVSTSLASSAASTYEVQTTNGASGGDAALQVGYLAVGVPL